MSYRIADFSEIARKTFQNHEFFTGKGLYKGGVHPAFVEIINQLSPDEAKLLRYLFTHITHIIVPTVTLGRANEQNEVIKNFSNIGELAECENPLKISECFDNLLRLGLLNSSGMNSLVDKTLYNSLKEHEYILSQKT